MKSRFYLAIIAATFAYIITIIIGLITFIPLNKILINGIIALTFTGLLTLFVVFFIEFKSNKKEEDEDIEKSKSSQQKDNSDDSEEDSFTPLNQTVMELQKEGEDN